MRNIFLKSFQQIIIKSSVAEFIFSKAPCSQYILIKNFNQMHLKYENYPLRDILSQIFKQYSDLSDSNEIRTHKHQFINKHSAILLNGWVFIYKLSGCGFKSHCCHLTLDVVPASSKEFLDIQANYRVWIHSETCTWHDNNRQHSDCCLKLQKHQLKDF